MFFSHFDYSKFVIISFKIMNPETLKYLQQDDIGKVIAKGLANLYTNKPHRPVKYLAEWLRTYSANQKELAGIVKAK